MQLPVQDDGLHRFKTSDCLGSGTPATSGQAGLALRIPIVCFVSFDFVSVSSFGWMCQLSVVLVLTTLVLCLPIVLVWGEMSVASRETVTTTS